MSKKHLIGIDIGTSFIKIGIYDFEGNCVGMISKDNPGQYPEPGVFLQSSEKIVSIVLNSLKEVLEKSGTSGSDVEAIGFSAAMGGLMGVDRNWNPVADWSIISDTRFYPYATRMLENSEKEIIELSGTTFPIGAPKILWWKNDFPEIYKNIYKTMGIHGFVAARLGGVPIDDAFMDKTVTIFSGIVDLKDYSWSEELCTEFGIDINILPKIVNSDSIAGKLTDEAASQCGLKAGTPLVAGAGDKAAGNLGAGLVEPGLLIDEAATYGALSLCVDEFVPDIRYKTLQSLPSPIEGLYNPGAYLFVSGATSAWFTDTFGEEEKKSAKERSTSVFKILDEKAAGIPPGSAGLMAIGLLGGRGYPSDPDIKGMWLGHTLSHKKEHFYRSILESFAYEYGYYLNVMKENYPELKFEEVLVMGGGARSDLYNQIKCDVMGLPYSRLTRDDFALLGDIILAGSAVGVFEDLKQTSKKFLKRSKKYITDSKNHETYKKYSELYAGLFDRVRDIFVDLKNISQK